MNTCWGKAKTCVTPGLVEFIHARIRRNETEKGTRTLCIAVKKPVKVIRDDSEETQPLNYNVAERKNLVIISMGFYLEIAEADPGGRRDYSRKLS